MNQWGGHVMNGDLDFAVWGQQRNLDQGMYGVAADDPNEPENPAETRARARIITLDAGQHIYRWAGRGRCGPLPEDKAGSGPWWSTKRGAMKILLRSRATGEPNTSAVARDFSNVARSWGNALDVVVCARVIRPIRCFMGVGRDVRDEKNGELWDSRELQLYIPNLSVKTRAGHLTLSEEARQHLRVLWVKGADAVTISDWNELRPRQGRVG
jgi:hypothetical protein